MTEKRNWVDLDKPLVAFTRRNTAMVNMDTNKPIQFYSANTRINIVQKTSIDGITYYRTATAKEKALDWAFRAADFGLPNDEAPLAHTNTYFSPSSKHTISRDKQKSKEKDTSSKSGEKWWKKLLKL